MNIYLLTQDINNDYGNCEAVVVSAESEEEARLMHPSGDDSKWGDKWSGWVELGDIDKINVKLIGESTVDEGVILASYNAW